MSKTPESSGFCQKMSAIGDYGFVKSLDPVYKFCVGMENWVFSRTMGPGTLTFIHKQPLSLDVIGDINVFTAWGVTPIISGTQ